MKCKTLENPIHLFVRPFIYSIRFDVASVLSILVVTTVAVIVINRSEYMKLKFFIYLVYLLDSLKCRLYTVFSVYVEHTSGNELNYS